MLYTANISRLLLILVTILKPNHKKSLSKPFLCIFQDSLQKETKFRNLFSIACLFSDAMK